MSKTPLRRHALVDFLRGQSSTHGSDSSLLCQIHPQRDFLIVRGPGSDAAFHEISRRHLGQDLPLKANTFDAGPHRIYWLGPSEWLVESKNNLVGVHARLSVDLSSVGAGASFVGGGFISLSLHGDQAEDLLRKGCTMDLYYDNFPAGSCAQTGLAKAAILIARSTEEPTFELLIRRSFAEYVAQWLASAGQEFGIRFQEHSS